MSMVTPTRKQKMLLDFIDAFVTGNGYSPTFREIMNALEYKSVSTVAKHVDNLIARGWLIKRDGEARSLEVVNPDEVMELAVDTRRSHEQWLLELVEQKKDGLTDEDTRIIERTLELLDVTQKERHP